MSKSAKFLQLLEAVKLEKGLSDVEIGEAIRVEPTYLSKIRNRHKEAGSKVYNRLLEFAREVGVKNLQELQDDEFGGAQEFLSPEILLSVKRWADGVGMSPREFIALCLLNYGRRMYEEIAGGGVPHQFDPARHVCGDVTVSSNKVADVAVASIPAALKEAGITQEPKREVGAPNAHKHLPRQNVERGSK